MLDWIKSWFEGPLPDADELLIQTKEVRRKQNDSNKYLLKRHIKKQILKSKKCGSDYAFGDRIIDMYINIVLPADKEEVYEFYRSKGYKIEEQLVGLKIEWDK